MHPPRNVTDASVIESNEPIVVQHPRLHSRQPALALVLAIVYGSD